MFLYFPSIHLPATEITLPIEPFVSVGTPIIVACIGVFGGALHLWLKSRFERLERQTAPTGDGYASRTEEALADLKTALERVSSDVGDVRRDVGGVRSEQRATNSRLDTLTDRFNDHLNN